MITIEQADRLWDAVDRLAASAEGVKMTAMKGWEYSPDRRAGLAGAVSAVVEAGGGDPHPDHSRRTGRPLMVGHP